MVTSAKFLILAVAVCTFKSNIGLASGNALSGIAAFGSLIDLAIESGAPFAKTALDRIHRNLFGSNGATRSSDVAIINTSSQNFILNSTECKHGGYVNDLFPEREINAHQSSVFRVASHGFASGVSCKASYKSENGYFKIKTKNPYFGKNSVKEESSDNLRLQATKGTGNNNQVRWAIYDN